MIAVSCKSCGHKIVAPLTYAGKRVNCPKCKGIVAVPQSAQQDAPAGTKAAETDLKLAIPDDWLTSQKTTRNPHHVERVADEAPMPIMPQFVESKETKPDGKRRHPWIIDIFLYPFSLAGTIQLVSFTVVPLLSLVTRGVAMIIYAYMAWYVGECVIDSAEGGVRAPDVIANAPSPSDAFGRLGEILVCCTVFFAPLTIYSFYFLRDNTVLWALAGYGIFFFPMSLLSVLIFDSLRALNPLLLIGSILSVFFAYCAMIAALVIVILGLWYFEPNPLVLFFALPYLLIVAAHLLGRFYFRNAKKLNWEV